MNISILDKPIRAIREALADISSGDAKALLEAEQNGKTRKGVIAALEEVLAEPEPEPSAYEPDDGRVEVRSILPEGTVLSLGDGRNIEPGETARVTPALAWFLRDRGQVE